MSYFCLTNLHGSSSSSPIISKVLICPCLDEVPSSSIHSKRDLMSDMKACSLNCSGQWCKFLQSKPMTLFGGHYLYVFCPAEAVTMDWGSLGRPISPHENATVLLLSRIHLDGLNHIPKVEAHWPCFLRSCCRVIWSSSDFVLLN